MTVVLINERGIDRVLDGTPGMTFPVDKFTDGAATQGRIVHVRDYRFPNEYQRFQIWSVPFDGYEILG